MLTQLTAKNFKGVPYLETSSLMAHHGGMIKFCRKKPNVIVGPNGAGKSALLTSLSLRFLAFYTGMSAYDNGYHDLRSEDAWWSKSAGWRDDWTYLQGLECKTDSGPVLYYRPGHIPGNDYSTTHAMMSGYCEEAKAYGSMIRDKSSGQQAQALQDSMLAALRGDGLPAAYGRVNWSGDAGWRLQDTKVKQIRAIEPAEGAVPMVVMDEPEQSLDALAEARLWRAIEEADCNSMQIVVATHSLHPILRSERFHLIETVSGYADAVRAQIPMD